MGCIITFVDGTELEVSRADLGESQEGENLYVLNDSDTETLVEVRIEQIRYIKWK